MRKVNITVTLNGASFVSEFAIDDNVKEYMIADDAFALAMRFAYTQMIATYGYTLNPHDFAEFINDLDYSYTIAN